MPPGRYLTPISLSEIKALKNSVILIVSNAGFKDEKRI
jgi:hypothetical protein